MEVQQMKRQFDLKIDQERASRNGASVKNNKNYRHAILNEVDRLLCFSVEQEYSQLFYTWNRKCHHIEKKESVLHDI